MLTPSVSLAYYRVMGFAKYLQRARTVRFTLFQLLFKTYLTRKQRKIMDNNTRYFYLSGDQQMGPFTHDELKNQHINRETLVWYDGIPDWEKASNIESLKDIFMTPPPIPKKDQKESDATSNHTQHQTNKKKSKTFRLILGILLVVAAIFIIDGISSGHISIEDFISRPKSEAELRMELLSKEKNRPLSYLSLNQIKFEKKLFAFITNEATITGVVKNSASLSKYKDLRVRVNYYSATNTIFKSHDYVIYKYFPPQSNIPIILEVNFPDGFSKYGVEILGATPAD